jgi:hypothetical protein
MVANAYVANVDIVILYDSYIKKIFYFTCRVGSYYFNEDCDFPSNNIDWLKLDKDSAATLTSTTKQPCGEACFAKKDCNYWVFNPKTYMCYLKMAPPSSSVLSPGKVCGVIPHRIIK